MGARGDNDAWSEACDRYPVGKVVEATVHRVVSFGLFLKLPQTGTPAVLLAPEFESGQFEERSELFPVGSTVVARVIGHASGRRQIDLSMRWRTT